MGTQYIINNSDNLLTGQTINGELNVTSTVTASTYYGDGSNLSGITITPSYKVYTALLTQTGTTEPTAIVLENTLGGDVIWTRNGVGDYIATLIGAFPDENKFFTPVAAFEIYTTINSISVYWNNTNSFQLNTFAGNGISIPYSPIDNLIFNYPLEIRVYP